VFERLADDIMEKENCGRAAAVTRIRTGGLRIFSTVDLRLQRMLEAFMENDGEDGYFPALWRAGGTQHSISTAPTPFPTETTACR